MRIMQPENKEKRQILLRALASVIKELRLQTGKSITLISNELNVSKSIWSDAEMGKSDLQFTTFWRIAEALEITPEYLVSAVKQKLPDGMSFIE